MYQKNPDQKKMPHQGDTIGRGTTDRRQRRDVGSIISDNCQATNHHHNCNATIATELEPLPHQHMYDIILYSHTYTHKMSMHICVYVHMCTYTRACIQCTCYVKCVQTQSLNSASPNMNGVHVCQQRLVVAWWCHASRNAHVIRTGS